MTRRNYDLDKYPAHSTGKPKAKTKIKRIDRVDLVAIIGLLVVFACVVSVLAITGSDIFGRSDDPQVAALISSTPFQPVTKTPKPPTLTSLPASPFPSLTSTIRSTQIPTKQNQTVKFIEVTKEIRITVEKMITATDQPATRTPTPTFDYIAAYAEIELERDRLDLIKEKSITFGSIVLALALVLILSARQVVKTYKRAINKFFDLVSVPPPPPPKPYNDRIASIPTNYPTKDELEQISEIIDQNPRISKTAIGVLVYGRGDGSYFYKVDRACKMLGYKPPQKPTTSPPSPAPTATRDW